MTSFEPPTPRWCSIRHRSSFQLLTQNLLSFSLSIDPLTKLMIRLMNKAQAADSPLPSTSASSTAADNAVMASLSAVGDIAARLAAKPLMCLVRRHYFELFTGGESLE